MTAPVPEETNEAFDLTERPADEHPSEAPGGGDADPADRSAAGAQEENAETSLDQPST